MLIKAKRVNSVTREEIDIQLDLAVGHTRPNVAAYVYFLGGYGYRKDGAFVEDLKKSSDDWIIEMGAEDNHDLLIIPKSELKRLWE